MDGIRQIIKSSVDSDADLLKLAKKMNVQVDQIDYKKNLDLRKDYAILNMADSGSGTHWVAVSNKDKLYFDPLRLPPPRVIPKDYKQAPFRVQNERFGHCGDYATLFLYYLQHDKLSNFYKQFQKYDPLF